MSKGTKFRDQFVESDKPIIDDITQGIETFIQREADMLKVDTAMFTAWKSRIVANITLALGRFKELPMQDSSETAQEEKQMKRAVRCLHRYFVVTKQDKADNRFVLVCKKHYACQVWEEAVLSQTYENCETTPETVAEEHVKWLMEDGLIQKKEGASKTHPRLYATVKAHKNPTGTLCSLTSLSAHITEALQVLQRVVDHMWQSVAVATGRM